MKVFPCSSILCLVSAAFPLGSIAACGDVDTYTIRSSSSGDSNALTSWEGAFVQLSREEPSCEPESSGRLVAIVGAHTEFPGEDVAVLKTPCSSGREAEVSIDVEGRSIIFDFSTVSAPGKFAAGGFDGYVVNEVVNAAAELLHATVDRDITTMELDDSVFRAKGHVVRANFEGMDFDETAFIKIDLTFAELDEI